jgi:hypothetical protein
LLEQPSVRAHMAHLLAGSDVRYDMGDLHRLSGRLLPDMTLADGRRVSELLYDARPVLLDLSGGAAASVAGAWAGRVDVVTAAMAQAPAAALLIRPDGYVAWAADAAEETDLQRLRASLERWFGSPA